MEMDCFGLNMMSNQIIFIIDVLRSIMELLVPGKIYCRGIVNHEWSLLYLFYPQIFKKSHIISFFASIAATYYAFVVESTRTDCLRDLQEIAPNPRLIAYPEVDTLVSLSPSKSES